MNDTQIANEILTTRGVNSCVYIDDLDGEQKPNVRKWTELHIGLHDFDIVSSRSDLLNRIMDNEGINILWLSSDNEMPKYHYWNLTCKTPNEILIDGATMGCDCKHVNHGFRRKKWVLRISGKYHTDGTLFKGSPKLLFTWCNPSTRPQSKPHFELFKAITGKTLLECDLNSYEWIGRSAQFETYLTITDKMKAVMNDG